MIVPVESDYPMSEPQDTMGAVVRVSTDLSRIRPFVPTL